MTFSEGIDSTVNLAGLHVRESGSSTGGFALTGSTYAVSGATATFTLTQTQQTALAALTTPQLDIDAGAVSDLSDNGIAAAPDGAITIDDTTQFDLAVSFQSEKSRSASPPAITADSQDYPSSAIPELAMQTAPEGPLQPVPADGTPYPLVIDENGYALHSSTSTVIPTQVTAGQPVTIKVLVYDPTPIAYFAVYLNLQGNDISHLQSDAQVIWNYGQVYMIDRSGLMRDITITISEDPDDPTKKTFTVTVTLSEGMGKTNMAIRMWNAAGQLAEVKIFDALDVRAPEPEPVTVDPEPTEMVNAVDPEPTADDDSAGSNILAIRMWSGFEPESITDAQLLASLDLDYPGMDIPSWVMTELGPLVTKGGVTAGEFKTALEYVLEHS